MANFMNSILVRKPGWSRFPLTHENKGSCNMSDIVPFLLLETNPGETFRVKSEIELKLAPMISPVMHRINLFTNYFYVPWFTIWSAYEDFIGGGREGDVVVEMPYLTPGRILNICINIGTRIGEEQTGEEAPTEWTDYYKAKLGFHNSWFDYIGLPQQLIDKQFPDLENEDVPPSERESNITEDSYTKIYLLPLMACLKIYHDYYQDETMDGDNYQHLEDFFNRRKEDWIASANLDDDTFFGNDELSLIFCRLQKRAWEHDYFTSALPFAQRGETVQVPIGGEAPVTIPDQEINLKEVGITLRNPNVTYVGGSLPEGATHWEIVENDVNNIRMEGGDSNEIQVKIQAFDDSHQSHGSTEWVNLRSIEDVDNISQITAGLNQALSGTADLSKAQAVSINTFRWLERLQMFLEKNARAGYRYVEQLLAHWGVIGDDKTLHRAEYLSGSVQPVKIGEVLQTSESTDDSPMAEYAGYGRADGFMNGFKHRFKYHGYIIGLMTVMPRTAYMQGIPRMFLKGSKYDFLFPEFAHLGEQPVYTGELYYQNADYLEDPDANLRTFGYMPRYSEYRTIPSSVHGDFQDNLDFWHMARKFTAEPQLNNDFIKSDSTERIFAVQGNDAFDKLYYQIINKVASTRPLPKYGTPSL